MSFARPMIYSALLLTAWSAIATTLHAGLLDEIADSEIGLGREFTVPAGSLGRSYLRGVYSVQLNDDERTLTATLADSVICWDFRSGEIRWETPNHRRLSADGSKSATESREFGASEWFIRDEKTKALLRLAGSWKHFFAGFSPDGSKLLTYDQRYYRVTAWDTNTGKILFVLDDVSPKGFHQVLTRPAFSTDGSMLVTQGMGKKLVLWDALTGRRLRTIHENETDVDKHGSFDKVWFNADGSLIGAEFLSGTVEFFDTHTGLQTMTLRGHSSTVQSVSMSPDGSMLLTVGLDGKAILWDRRTGSQLKTFPHPHPLYSASFNSNGTKIVVGDDSGHIFTWRIGFTPQEMKDKRRRAALVSTGADVDFFQETAEKRFKLPWLQERDDQ